MNGNIKIRLVLPRQTGTLAQTDIIIPLANHHRAHAPLAVNQYGQLAGDGQHHTLFIDPAITLSTGILSAMTGIDGNDQIT